MNISAIVMASGMSMRMNADKLKLKINDKKIYEYIFETIREHNFYETIVVAKDDEILEDAKNFGFKGVKNTKYYMGQSESIKAGLENSKKADGFMFFVADQPFIKLTTIKKLCNEFYKNPHNIIVPYYNEMRGNPVIFPYEMKTQLMAIVKDNGGKIVINANLDKVIRVDIETKNEFMDIDTKEDYERVKNMDVIK